MTPSEPLHRTPAADPSDEAQHAALTTGVRCRLEETGVLAVRGRDAAPFLNGQFSSDITALRPGDAALTSYSDARGRVLATPRIFVEPERLLLAVPAERLAAVRQQLTKYVLRADVQIEERAGADACLGVAGSAAAPDLETFAGALPKRPWQAVALPDGGVLARAPGERPRWLACGPTATLDRLWEALAGQLVEGGDAAWRLTEIEAGVPDVYAGTAEHFVAQMINLDRLGAVDFHKGCYPGQEVVARTHYLGRIKRRMHVLRSEGGTPLGSGDSVYAGGELAGEIVHAAAHPDGGYLALAVLRLESAGSALTLGAADGPAATAAPPPYALED